MHSPPIIHEGEYNEQMEVVLRKIKTVKSYDGEGDAILILEQIMPRRNYGPEVVKRLAHKLERIIQERADHLQSMREYNAKVVAENYAMEALCDV